MSEVVVSVPTRPYEYMFAVHGHGTVRCMTHGKSQVNEHRLHSFKELKSLLGMGDRLVFNDAKDQCSLVMRFKVTQQTPVVLKYYWATQSCVIRIGVHQATKPGVGRVSVAGRQRRFVKPAGPN